MNILGMGFLLAFSFYHKRNISEPEISWFFQIFLIFYYSGETIFYKEKRVSNLK
jgi:hypothetical protein